ncbi:MAG: hypothetical protein WDN28_28590 [Chthoniobacter sp.]
MLPVREMRKVPGSEPASAALASVATMVTIGVDEAPIVPGEPISLESPAALKAPWTPTALKVEMVALVNPAELSKVG